jgi:internalin A
MRCFLGTILAVVITSNGARADEAAALKRIEHRGGYVTRDDKKPGKPVIAVAYPRGNATDEDLKGLKDLKQLTSLDLHHCRQLTDAGLKELREVKQLAALDLGSTEVVDAWLKELKEAQQLTVLSLAYTEVTDTGLKELKGLKQLKSLDLSVTLQMPE